MGSAYTPGLAVSARAVVEKVRRLPIKGKVLVAVGQPVGPDDAVARAELPGDVETVRIAEALGLEPSELGDKLRVKVGDKVEEGQVLAEARFLFGLMKSEAHATTTGTVDFFSTVTGHMGVRKPPVPVEVKAYIRGKVKEILPEEGVIVETTGALVQGIFGVGPERVGRISVVAKRPDDELTASMIPTDCRGLVLVGGSSVSLEVLRLAASRGAVGMVVGGIQDTALTEYVGRRIGVAVTGQENVPTSLVLTEGFGSMPMAARTFGLFIKMAGRECSLSGATQIRAGVQRPEVVVPIEFSDGAVGAARAEGGGELNIGTPIRVIRVPYFGMLGSVTALPPELVTLESGSHVRVLKAKLANGEEVTVPRANVEIISG